MDKPTMSFKEALDLVFKLSDNAKYFWNVHVVLNVAVTGWLVSLKEPLTLTQRVFCMVGYLALWGTNLRELLITYTLLRAVRTEMSNLTETISFTNKDLGRLLRELSYPNQKRATWALHLLSLAVMMYVLWTNML